MVLQILVNIDPGKGLKPFCQQAFTCINADAFGH